jgi:hypothetical protein
LNNTQIVHNKLIKNILNNMVEIPQYMKDVIELQKYIRGPANIQGRIEICAVAREAYENNKRDVNKAMAELEDNKASGKLQGLVDKAKADGAKRRAIKKSKD